MSISIAGNIPEAERVKILRDLSRLTIDNPPAAQEGYANIRPYKPKGAGWVYVEINADEVVIEGRATAPANVELDYLNIKVGETGNMARRREDYRRTCKGVDILWAYCYPTQHAKLIERLVHIDLTRIGAHKSPHPCPGCNVNHREYFSERLSGGLEGVAARIEYWQRRLGEGTCPHTAISVDGT
ncbi:hypothetical protein C8R44DRAFT_886284 [Mycena epipterygia]|nr:hypothetical protein C8R44DRAFT_886284 [Mycena epipterygia]